MMRSESSGKRPVEEVERLRARVLKLEYISRAIAEHKDSEEQIDEAWLEWERTFDAMKDPIILLDNQLKVIQANSAALLFSGKSFEEIVDRQCWQVIHGLKGPPENCPVMRSQKTKQREQSQFYLKNKDVWIEALADPILDKQGNVIKSIHIIRDITERKKAEQLIRSGKDKAQRYLDVAGVIIVAIDSEGRVGLINKKGSEILGYKEEEILGKNWFDNYLPTSIRGELKKYFRKILIKEVDLSENFENPILTRTGQERLINWHNTILKDESSSFIAILCSGEDITERKKAEQALRESEEHYRMLAETINDGLTQVDENGIKIYVNKKCAEIFGYTVEQMIGHHWSEFYDEQARKIIEQEQHMRKNGITKSFEVMNTTRDGRKVYLHISPQGIYDKDGKYEGTISILSDVTDQRKAEKAFRESEKKFRTLYETMAQGVVYQDAAGIIISANPAAERILGLTLDQMQERASVDPRWKAIHEDGSDYPGEQHPAMVSLHTGKAVNGVVMGIYNPINDEYRWILIDAVPEFRDGESNPYRVYTTFTDITERKVAEEILMDNEATLTSIFKVAPIGIGLISNRVLLQVNDRMCEMLDYTSDELIGNDSRILYPSDKEYEYVGKEKYKQIREHGTGTVEAKWKRKDGRIIDMILSSTPLDPSNLSKGVTFTALDITDRKKAEQELLQEQNRLKALASELTLAEEHERRRVAIELHDQIGQLLAVSKMKLEEIINTQQQKKTSSELGEIRRMLGQAITEARDLVFDLSSPVLYDLGFEAAVSEWLGEEIGKKYGIKTDFVDDGQSKPMDEDIRILLFRNVRELLVNVVKHAKAKNVKVSLRRIGKTISVSVEDDGVGIKSEGVVRIPNQTGGFGLFSIRQRLEELGGRLEIDTDVDKGTKIIMTAPLTKKSNNKERK